MRRPRDLDAELQALDERARVLRLRKVNQLGELVIACKADTLSVEVLAGALLDAAATTDASQQGAWRQRGAAFFRKPRPARSSANASGGGAATSAASAGAASSSDARQEPR